MCGIVGQVFRDGSCDLEILVTMRDTMSHRGPDDLGVWLSADSCVSFGHRRLSVIDLSPAGHQPMLDNQHEICITFNGEIYNYRELKKYLVSLGHHFRSESDTEVVLEAYREWGPDCLDHLNGMFAFGLYDTKSRILFLARDRAGEKPLFYSVKNNSLVFASELKAIFADPAFDRRIDPLSLNLWLQFGYVPGDRCIMKGVKKLPPAHALTWNLETGEMRVWRYWHLPTMQNQNKGPVATDDLVEKLHDLLEDSVQRQLVADVNVGVLLSGGVDSSLVTAMAARHLSKVKTFTVRFPGYPNFDETDHARIIAKHFSTEHVELVAEPAILELLPKLACQFDEPMVDSSMIPTYLVCRLIRSECTVALGGDGGDELFGGYGHYRRLLRTWTNLGWIPSRLRVAVAGLSGKFLPTGFKGRNYLVALGQDPSAEVPQVNFMFDREARKRILRRDLFEVGEKGFSLPQVWVSTAKQDRDLIDMACRMDFNMYLPEDILVKLDRSSMLNSLELRAPFLDQRIVEFAFAKVPSRLKATQNRLKILPKLLGKRLFPENFEWNRKQGFSIPLHGWLRNDWREFLQETLLNGRSGLWETKEVRKLWKGHLRGYSNSERLFGLMLFELWRKEHRIAVP